MRANAGQRASEGVERTDEENRDDQCGGAGAATGFAAGAL